MAMTSYDCNKNLQLTKNWNTKEFKCHGSGHIHNTLINKDLVNMVQTFMDKYGLTKGVMSRGYSCSEYNKKIGGATNSKHVTEGAMDVCFYKGSSIVSAKQICCWATDFGFPGVAYIDKNYVHLDKRTSGIYRGDETKGYSNNVPNGDFYTYFGISKDGNSTYNGTFPTLPSRGYFKNGDKSDQVKNLQKFLNWATGANLSVDGIIGTKTINAVKSFQKNVGVPQDGLFGKNSLAKAKTYTK